MRQNRTSRHAATPLPAARHCPFRHCPFRPFALGPGCPAPIVPGQCFPQFAGSPFAFSPRPRHRRRHRDQSEFLSSGRRRRRRGPAGAGVNSPGATAQHSTAQRGANNRTTPGGLRIGCLCSAWSACSATDITEPNRDIQSARNASDCDKCGVLSHQICLLRLFPPLAALSASVNPLCF